MHLSFRILLFIVVFVGAGCGVKSARELKGTYSAKHAQGSETLILEDTTFTQVYTPFGTNVSVTNSGTWEFWKTEGAILLRDVIEFDKEGQTGKQPFERIVWRVRVVKRFGKINLVINEEDGLDYVKKK